ncbi:MAG: hypothetical protein ACOYBJ_03590 [Patescibacteria group bacterium]|jgi:ribosomal protein L34
MLSKGSKRTRAKRHGFFARKQAMIKMGKKGMSAVMKRRIQKGRERLFATQG